MRGDRTVTFITSVTPAGRGWQILIGSQSDDNPDYGSPEMALAQLPQEGVSCATWHSTSLPFFKTIAGSKQINMELAMHTFVTICSFSHDSQGAQNCATGKEGTCIGATSAALEINYADSRNCR